MATKADLLSELNWVTEKISSQVWTLNLGTLGTTWSLLIATAVPETIRFTPRNAVWVVIPSLLSLLCEMGQVLAAYSLDRKLLKKMEESNAAEFQYPTTDWRYRLRHCFFHTKIVLTIGAATILLFTLVRKFVA
jgi:hypothetical protein